MWLCGNTHLLLPPKFLCVLAEVRAALTLVVVDMIKVIDQAKIKVTVHPEHRLVCEAWKVMYVVIQF
jgi:hypothetical protein